MDTFQILVGAGLLVMAAMSAISLAWAFYLDGKLRNRPSPKHYEVQVQGAEVFSEEDLVTVGAQAREGLSEVVQKSADMLQASLSATISGLNTKAEDMITITLSQEFEKYQASLAALREETIKEFSDLQGQLDERRTQLSAALEAEVAKDREARMELFNARLGDVVSSYIVETLDKGVDLGAQSAYIVRTLETHKEDIKKDVLS